MFFVVADLNSAFNHQISFHLYSQNFLIRLYTISFAYINSQTRPYFFKADALSYHFYQSIEKFSHLFESIPWISKYGIRNNKTIFIFAL